MKTIICPDCECDDIQITGHTENTISCLCYECGGEFTVEGDIEEIDIEDLFD